jgi:hypothetical protein
MSLLGRPSTRVLVISGIVGSLCGCAGIVSFMASGKQPSPVAGGSLAESGYVLITEMMDINDGGRFSGLFTAHWESKNGEGFERGPEDVPVGEAIAWGRKRSDVVLVQVGGGEDGTFSAGRRAVLDEDTELWPHGGLNIVARPEGSALDGSEQEVMWVAHVKMELPSRTRERVIAYLRQDATVVALNAAQGNKEGTVDVVLRASGAKPAVQSALETMSTAIARSGYSTDRPELHFTVEIRRSAGHS